MMEVPFIMTEILEPGFEPWTSRS